MRKLLAVAALAVAFAVPAAAIAADSAQQKFAELEAKISKDLTDEGAIFQALLGALGSKPEDVTALQQECPGIPKPTGEVHDKTRTCIWDHAAQIARTRKSMAAAHAADAADAVADATAPAAAPIVAPPAATGTEPDAAAADEDEPVDPRLATATEAFVVAHCAKDATIRWITEDVHFVCRDKENAPFEGKCRISKKKTSCGEVLAVALRRPPPAAPAKPEGFWCHRSVGQGLLCYVPAAVAVAAGTVAVVKGADNTLAVFEQR